MKIFKKVLLLLIGVIAFSQYHIAYASELTKEQIKRIEMRGKGAGDIAMALSQINDSIVDLSPKIICDVSKLKLHIKETKKSDIKESANTNGYLEDVAKLNSILNRLVQKFGTKDVDELYLDAGEEFLKKGVLGKVSCLASRENVSKMFSFAK
jgi:hypothetical protein